MTEGIKDEIVVVTGPSSGFGEATARLPSAEGAIVVLGARGGKALAMTTDVSQREEVDINEILYRPTRQEL